MAADNTGRALRSEGDAQPDTRHCFARFDTPKWLSDADDAATKPPTAWSPPAPVPAVGVIELGDNETVMYRLPMFNSPTTNLHMSYTLSYRAARPKRAAGE